jgi:hypothetical protein
MDRDKFTDSDIFWKVIIHVLFIFSALCLAVLDRITDHSKNQPPPPPGH